MRIRNAMWAITVLVLPVWPAGCSYEESGDARETSYAKNVESCMCRSLEFEVDNFSGLTYLQLLERCNHTVHNANPQRYAAAASSSPEPESLRCQDDMEEWLEVSTSDT